MDTVVKPCSRVQSEGSTKSLSAGAIIVAPHSDDAAFSLGGGISRFRRPLALATVFGRDNYTVDGGLEPDWRYVSERRKREDQSFALRHGLDWTYLDFSDAGLRFGDWDLIFVPEDNITETLKPDLELFNDSISGELLVIIQRLSPAFLVLPAGIGRNRDHLLVREIGQQLARTLDLTAVYYEDLPYANDLSDAQITEWMTAIDPKLRPVTLYMDGLGEKLQSVRLYETQVNSDVIERLSYAATRRGDPAERLWLSGSPLKLLESGVL